MGNFTPYRFTPPSLGTFDGLQIIVSEHALKESDVRLFPASKNRSARIHKKLVKRFGGEFRKVPCIFQMGNQILMHPERYQALKDEMRRRQEAQFFKALEPHP